MIDHHGELLFYADEGRARELIRNRKVTLCWSAKRVRALQVVDTETATAASGGWGHESGRHYSHDRATDSNPRGVWTLVHLPRSTKRIFRKVLTDCLAA